MSIDIVRGELERLFSLEELQALSTDLLGFEPDQVGGAASKASFAKALTEHAAETHAVAALLDCIVSSRPDVEPRLREMARASTPVDGELAAGTAVGPFVLGKKVAEGPRAIIYAAKKEGEDRTVKVFRLGASADVGSARRFLARLRLLAPLEHENLPATLEAGQAAGRIYVGYQLAEGQTLATRVQRSGALHVNEAKPILRGILGALAKIHEARLAHGNLKLENVVVARGPQATSPTPYLIDASQDRLGFATSALAKPWLGRAIAPEMVRGLPADAASDLYMFGALLFELLTGKPPLSATTGADLFMQHLTAHVPVPSSVAARGWITKELDDLILSLLDKNPDRRPKSARAVLDALEAIGRPAIAGKISPAEFDAHVDALVADPADHDAALALEGTIEAGASPEKVAEAFAVSAESIDDAEGDEEAATKVREQRKSLLYRAARIYITAKKQEQAEDIYLQILAQDPTDDIARAAVEELRRQLGKHEELIEMLLERREASESHAERARCLNQIGQIYVRELDDREQGLFAFAQALAQDVQNDDYAGDLERAAGTDMRLWSEALQILTEVSTHPRMPPEAKVTLYTRLGTWYAEKIARPDLGLPCFQAVLQIEPAHDGALAGMASVYRRAQQWQELGQVLLRRADRAPTPDRAREYRAHAADLLETKLSDPGRARDLYEQIIQEDPAHDAATVALSRIYQALGDNEGLAKILVRRSEALRGEARVEAVCRIAEMYEDQLNNLPEAHRRYEAALELDPSSLNALRGLDRILNRQGRYGELLEVLDRQLAVAATPRQKINLLERIAGIHEEEFLDHAKAAEALERIVEIDSGNLVALTSLVRHYRATDRWEDVITSYERELKLITEDKPRIETLVAMGRVLVEQVGSPHRAQKVYERVLEIEPSHGGSLESLAHLRAATGDAEAALAAVEALAGKAETPEQKSDLWIRAAKMLEEAGDKDGAIERYKAALDALPSNAGALLALRKAYLARGDVGSAVELLIKEIEIVDGKIGKAKLYGEMAMLLRDKVKDMARAQEAATKAVDLDPTSLHGQIVTGDLAFDAGRYLEASKAFEIAVGRADSLNKTDSQRLVARYIESLSKLGETARAASVADQMLDLAGDSPEARLNAAKVYLMAGDAKRSAKLYEEILELFDDKLGLKMRSETLLGLGSARLALGDLDQAILPLSEAADLDPESNLPIDVLTKVYEQKGDWEELIRIKTRRLDALTGEDRTTLLLEIGDICSQKLNDRTRASKSYVAALDERPDDRRVLTKLMQLYSEEKDWSRLVDVVLKLASMVTDAKQKAKYLHTAAIVAGRQMGELERAAKFYDDVLELDPSLDKAINEAIDVRDQLGDHEGVERLLKLQLDSATDTADRDRLLVTFEKLGKLYREKLGWTGEAIDAYEAAQTLDPDNEERNELLGQLYASDPAQYLDKAVAAQSPIIHKNPHRPEPYRLLRKLYTEAKRADEAWCLCQALTVMNLAEPDEERFYRRMRADGAAAAQSRFDDNDWAMMMHPDADPLVTKIFELIEPAVLIRNGTPLDQLGYQEAYALDLVRHPYPMSQTIYYAAGVFGMEPPPTFQNPQDPGGISFLHARRPSIVLGSAALALELPGQPAAFVAGRHLAYYRPGLYIRHLVPTGTGLRAWLFAAIKMVVPAFPIAPELEGAVAENLSLLERMVTGGLRDQLTSHVTKLLQAGAIDLKKWVIGVDLSADRAALILANDLEVSLELIRAADETSAAVTQRERTRELLFFAVSEQYFALRKRLGVNIDA